MKNSENNQQKEGGFPALPAFARMLMVAGMLLTAGLLLVACQPATTSSATPPPESGGGTAYAIRSIEEVSAGGPPQIVDITDTEAVLLFESSQPLACSVVYGPTAAYGLIAVDQDMGGGAHTDHHPVLAGLEPDTGYHYRVQGTAPDGTLYISGDMTFRTAPARETAELNLASPEAGARVVAVSSNFGGAADDDEPWGAGSAFDGNRATAWSSSGDGNNAFIEIELAEPSRLHAVEVWTRSMSDGTAQISTFTLTTDSGEVLGPFTLADAEQAHRFDLDAVARTLRLDVVESTGGNTGLIEFAVFGAPTVAAAPTNLQPTQPATTATSPPPNTAAASATNPPPALPPATPTVTATNPPLTEPARAPSDTPSPAPTVAGLANADVLQVRAVQSNDGSWTFHVTVQHPETGWEDYADGWDVVSPDGTVLKPDPESPFTRLLLHPHENEQPFTRSQSGIVIPTEVTQVRVRAHDLVAGFGGREVLVDLTAAKGEGFEVERAP